jgi:hypothetical protein
LRQERDEVDVLDGQRVFHLHLLLDEIAADVQARR